MYNLIHIYKYIYSLSQYIWSPNLPRWWHSGREWPLSRVVLWSHMTNQIHNASTYRISMHTKLGKILTYCERLQTSRDPLMTWPMWDLVTKWKVQIPTFTILMATKLGRVLTSGRRLDTETLKSSPTSC